MAYNYKVLIIPTGQYYIGSQYNKKSNPKDLGVSYFTSSSLVQRLIFEYGKSNVAFTVLGVFDNKEQCIKHEYTLINECVNDILCLNRQHNNSFKESIKKAHAAGRYEERNKKQAERMKQLWQQEEFKHKMTSNRSKTRRMSLAERNKKAELMRNLHQLGRTTYDNTSGTIWINNGSINKRIQKSAEIPNGYKLGRYNYIRRVKN